MTRRPRGLFSNNSRNSWVAVAFGRPSLGERAPDLTPSGDRIGPSSVGERGVLSALRDLVGAGTLSRLEVPLVVADSFVAVFCEEGGSLWGGGNIPGRSRLIGEMGGV